MAFDWLTAAALLAAWWKDRQKSSGSEPNFYPRPLTPEEKYWDDARKKLFESSPTRDYMTGLGSQFLGQLDVNPKNHSFLSDAMKGQTYGAGFVAPKFDLSKLPSLGGPTGPGVPKRPGDPGGPGVGGPGGRDIDPANDGGDPLNPRGGNGPFGPSPYGLDGMPTDIPKGGPDGGFSDWFAKYRADNPGWWKQGVAALITLAAGELGMTAVQVAGFLKDYMTKNSPDGTPLPGNFSGDFGPNNLPPSSANFGGMMGQSPGVKNGLPTVTDGGFGSMMQRSKGVAGPWGQAQLVINGNTYHWNPATQKYEIDTRVNYNTPGNQHTGGMTGIPGGSTFAGQTAGWGQKSGGSSGRGAGARLGRWR